MTFLQYSNLGPKLYSLGHQCFVSDYFLFVGSKYSLLLLCLYFLIGFKKWVGQGLLIF